MILHSLVSLLSNAFINILMITIIKHLLLLLIQILPHVLFVALLSLLHNDIKVLLGPLGSV